MPSRLFVISGPSGAGKGTLVARLLEAVPQAWVSVSATTRKPRPTDVDGQTYVFMTQEQFEDGIAHDEFLEWARYNGNYYGTPLGPIREHIAQGQTVILEIEVQGAFQVREKLPEACLIFIAPPSMEELEQRLVSRGTESQEEIAQRIATAQHEMTLRDSYDICLVNDDLEEATKRLVALVESEQ